MRQTMINKLLLLSISLALAACNGDGDSGSNIAGNWAPVIAGGDSASVSIDENTTAVSTITATDADAGDTLTFSLSGGEDQAQFSITTGGVLTFATAPNYEAPADADTNNIYVVVVQVSDGKATDTQTVTVTVDDVTESTSIGGGGIKGPLVDAIVTAYVVDTSNTSGGFKGSVAGVPGTTDAQAKIQGLGLPFPVSPPYILEFTSDQNTTDIMTGQFPVISEMRTVITQQLLDSGEQIYATPLTTMAVDLAIKNADVNTGVWASDQRDLDLDDDGIDDFTLSLGDSTVSTDEFLTALPIAAAQVKSTMGFGMSEDIDIFDTPPLIDSTTNTQESQEQAAAYRAAVEAVTAVVNQIDNATGTEDANSVLSALTNDLADGQIDGKEDGQTSDIFGGTSDDAEETANAALQLLEQDPATLPIPNDPQGRTVGQMKQVISDEKQDLGNDNVATEIATDEEVELKPAETNPDIDGDGVPNDKDAFPEDPTETKDTDKDGIGNNTDPDDDNDGVLDDNDAFPLNKNEQVDTDGDGIGNNADTDDDGDGTLDTNDDFPLDPTRQNKSDQDNDGWPSEQDANDNNNTIPGTTFVDTDGDGVADATGGTGGTDTDDDNDGVANNLDAFPRNAAEQKDTDGDAPSSGPGSDGTGYGDNSDPDIDGDGVANADDKFPRNPFETKDTDRDGIGNNADEDDDGDGVSDAQEAQNGTNPLKRDTDGDGVLDNVDQAPNDPTVQFDSDKDGIDNANDNCPVHYNPTQSNIDGDDRGDACDKDKDGDGVDNAQDAFPDDRNESLDTDNDGIGNNSDDDDDNDGVLDGDDAFPLNANETKDTDNDGTGDNSDTDRDGDGVDNDQDAFPNDPSEDTDTDGDGIGNNSDDDIDGDGIGNADDAFPLQASASTDTDGDGEPNVTDTDDDGDGVADVDDAFPLNANETTDTDKDGIGDNSDPDIDGDGIANENDRFPLDKNEYLDTDNDGIGDKSDTDRDGDGVDNTQDAFPLNPNESVDTDGDGIGNNADTDDDNDGLSDAAEATKGSNPLLRDTDSDGRRDGTDNCPIVANTDQKDSDGDGLGDVCDTDDDADTVADNADNCPLTPNTNQADQDQDGKGDACDTDRDGDGVLNTVDNCPTTSNTNQSDANGNGIGDACDADADQDGVVDELDNCPSVPNSDQLDTDSDRQGNACDTDDDNDGLTDSEEATKGTNPLKADTDGDGVNDKNDVFPTNPLETKDTDGDGIGDNSDNNKDTDTIPDADDNCPLISNEDQRDTDNDGKGDVCDSDDDGDGVNDALDAFPLDGSESKDQDSDQIGDNADNCKLIANNDQTDSDGDGIGNACDLDNDNDGVPDAVDNCPTVVNPAQKDQDQDGQGNLCDTDDDNDGVADAADNCPLVSNADQADIDNDTIGNVCDSDRDGDGLSNLDESALGTNPDLADSDSDGFNDGADNCPARPNADQLNTDGDAKGDACDADDDNDGVLDADDAFPTDKNESKDSDSDTIGDNADNCPVTANTNQADTDGDGIGDVCDDLPVVSLFYLNERVVDAETETDDSGVDGGVCPFNIGDEMTRVSLWLQDGAAIKVSFGDDGLGHGTPVAIDTAGNITASSNDSHSDENGSVDFSLEVTGQLDSGTGVITAAVTETFIYKDSTDAQVASCAYTSTETFTPMNQAQASTIFDGQSGTNIGFVWMDAWEKKGDSSGTTSMSEPGFDFSYGLVDNIDETEYRYDFSASTADKWIESSNVESSYFLGATGWVSVSDQHIVQGVPGATINLVAKDASENILVDWLITPFSANVTNEPMMGLVPREWSDEGLTAPAEVFAGSSVLAIGIHAISQMDVYEIRCPDHQGSDAANSTLDCLNAMMKSDGSTGLTYAQGLGEIVFAPGTTMTQNWQGVPAGYMEEGQVFAYLTGTDTSGAEGSTGTASFYRYDDASGNLINLGVNSTWTIVDPNNNDTDLLIKFTLPTLVSEQFDDEERPDAMIVSVLPDTSDSQPYVRGGHYRAAGRHFYESGLNGPAIEEVKGNFAYVGDSDGDGLKDDVDTDDDNDGVEDSLDAFPLDPSESTDTDGDGIGDNKDTDIDGDGVLNEDEAQNGTDPMIADTDDDGLNDGSDNCPSISNSDQVDSDDNGIGDACDGAADVSGFWKAQRAITATDHTGDTGLCEGNVDDIEATIVQIKQNLANVDIRFGDEDFKQGDMGTVNAAAELSWDSQDLFNEHDNADGTVSGSVEETWSFMGTPDDATTPTVISDTTATSSKVFYNGQDQTGDVLATCQYTYSASLSRMSQVNADVVLNPVGIHQGMAYSDASDVHVPETQEDVYEFEYGQIDSTSGEQNYEWDASIGEWSPFTPSTDLMLSAGGWGLAVDQISVAATPAETADLVITDGSIVYSTLRIKLFETALSGLPYEGFVNDDLVKASFDPAGTFGDANSRALAIEAENVSDAYRIPCDIEDENYRNMGLSCINAYIKDWSNWPSLSQTDLAVSLTDALHTQGVQSTLNDKGLWIGRTREGDNSKQVYAFFTGSDTSGAAGTSGTVSFTTHHFDGQNYNVVAIQEQGLNVTTQWSISEPVSGETVLKFTIPDFLFREFDIEWRDESSVILAAVQGPDSQSYLRFGGMKPAGQREVFQLVNFTAMEEVISGFNYVKPDSDSDGVSDDEDNCPVDANSDQADSDGNGKGDVCDGGTGGPNPQPSGLFINLLGRTATSTIIESNCGAGNAGGWAYSFDQTGVTLVGSDSWDNCVLGAEETLSVGAVELRGNFDIPFSCTHYPYCLEQDMNKTIQGVDQDMRPFTSTYQYDPDTLTLTYVKTVPGTSYSETVVLNAASDNDSDGMNDDVDHDDDNDNVSDYDEIKQGSDPLNANSDGDSFNDFDDNCPIDDNEDQADTDGDGIGDVCQANAPVDSDLDDLIDTFDNCPNTYNPDQFDKDGDKLGDACDDDIDGDGILNDQDNCESDFDTTNNCGTQPSQDSDNDGVSDNNDPFPYNPEESADSDNDGVGDNTDAFPNNASEQFDSDDDGVGDKADLCPLVAAAVQGVNHSDSDGDGVGDECDVTVNSLEGVWLLSGDPDDANQVPDDNNQSCVTDQDTGVFYTKAQIKQLGNQVWLHIDGDTFAGLIDGAGDFSLEAQNDPTPTIISGNFDGSDFTNFGYVETETVASGTCDGFGTLAMTRGTDVSEELAFTNGVTWFESDDYNDTSGQQVFEFNSGTLFDSTSEVFRSYNDMNQTWETVTDLDSDKYLTTTGILDVDDAYTVDGYVNSVSGDTALIKPTISGVPNDVQIAHVDLMEVDLAGLPMLAFLDEGYMKGLSDTDSFSANAKGYIGTITQQVTGYNFWCDSDWDQDFFAGNLACDNIVPIGSIENGTHPDGSKNFDPVAATSLEDVISTPSELAAFGSSTQSRGMWVGDRDNYTIHAYLQTDDGTVTGANPTVIFVKDYWNGLRYKVGQGVFETEMIGSTQIIKWQIPDNVRQLGDEPDRQEPRFIFVDQDTINGNLQNVLRYGEIREQNMVEHEFLFNEDARSQIEAAFNLMASVPQSFLDASNNGVEFSASSTITNGFEFGVAGYGIRREWDNASGDEINELYLFDSTGDGGRYVFEQYDSSQNIIDSADQAFTWSVDLNGNLEIIITSSGVAHQIALKEFNDDYRPIIVVLNPFNAPDAGYAERLVTQTQYLAEVSGRVDLSSQPLDGTSFTYINPNPDSTDIEVMFFNNGGAWEWQNNSVVDDSATWSVDTTENFITLDFGDGSDTLAIEDIYQDASDKDGDGDITENIYLFTGWYELDASTGLGSFFRDEFYKNP